MRTCCAPVVRTFAIAGLVLSVAGCGERAATANWAGSVDTLPSGVIRISNPSTGIWDDQTAWVVTEQLRIGSAVGEGPDVFGRITDFTVDPAGRIYVFDGQAQELRVFGEDGSYLRTVGRKGGGPGEFERVIGLTWSPQGELWLVDPANNRISVIDTSGTYRTSHQTLGGFVIIPWPGGFDRQGFFYNYGIDPDRVDDDFFPLVLIRHGENLVQLDTARTPRYRGEQPYFERRSGGSVMRAGVPHTPGLTWRLAPSGDIWFALTGDYEIYQQTFTGDTLRLITKDFTPLPVTQEDLAAAREELEWFTRQGGVIDLSRVPGHKPALRGFFFDGSDNIWVEPVVAADRQSRVFDIFDADGRFLGQVETSFPMETNPKPVFAGDFMYAVTRDDLDVQYIVKARMGKPVTDTGDVTVGGG